MDIPSNFVCPITQEIMKDPVSDNEGISYEKEYIEKWLSRNRTSPISRRPLHIGDLRPNIALKNLISAFNEKLEKEKHICNTAYNESKNIIEKIIKDYQGVVIRSRFEIDKQFLIRN